MNQKIIGKYLLLKVVGKGEYGKVYLGKDQVTGKQYAIKEING